MNCPTCGNEYEPGSKFCRICGSTLPTEEAIPGPEQPMVSFSEAISRGFRNYFNFRGRATRAEFWWWALFSIMCELALVGVATIFDIPYDISDLVSFLSFTPWGMFDLATLIPSLAVGARRLHDINRPVWWSLLLFSDLGWILLIVWATRQGIKGRNKYGPDPRTTPRS